MSNNPLAKNYPSISVKEVTDVYVQKNFRALQDYFSSQNQLLNFNFIEFVFTAAVANQKITHGLTIIPQDVIVTRVTGTGVATLNWASFDSTNIDVTVTGPCRIRFFVGSYWNQQTSQGNSSTDVQQLNQSAVVQASAAVASTTINVAVPTGVYFPFGGSILPSGYLFCDGSEVSRITYNALFLALGSGTLYGGGDSSTTFNLPDLRGRSVAGKDDMNGQVAAGRMTAVKGFDGTILGNGGGEQTHVLITAELASHSHRVGGMSGAGGPLTNLRDASHGPAGDSGGTTFGYVANIPAGGGAGQPMIENTGSGTGHNTVQPTIITNFIIKT